MWDQATVLTEIQCECEVTVARRPGMIFKLLQQLQRERGRRVFGSTREQTHLAAHSQSESEQRQDVAERRRRSASKPLAERRPHLRSAFASAAESRMIARREPLGQRLGVTSALTVLPPGPPPFRPTYVWVCVGVWCGKKHRKSSPSPLLLMASEMRENATVARRLGSARVFANVPCRVRAPVRRGPVPHTHRQATRDTATENTINGARRGGVGRKHFLSGHCADGKSFSSMIHCTHVHAILGARMYSQRTTSVLWTGCRAEPSMFLAGSLAAVARFHRARPLDNLLFG